MSVDTVHTLDQPGPWLRDRRRAQVLRYAVGSTLALSIALIFNWQLAFLTPLLTLKFLASPGPRPSLKAGTAFLIVVAISCVAALMFSRYLISYPLVYIPATSLLLLRLFYLKAAGKAPALMTMLLVSLLVIPLIVMTSAEVAQLAAQGILMAAVVTVGVVWLVHALFPDPACHAEETDQPTSPADNTPSTMSSPARLRTAAIGALVLFPVFVLVYAFQLTDLLVVLIFVALLASRPEFATNFKIGAALIVGNVLGGAFALVFYEALVMVPSFGFLVLLTLLVGLVFGAQVFSDKRAAKLYAMAFSTLLLVIGSVTASGTDVASSMVYARVAQISLAVTYCVLAFGVADRFLRQREA